MSLINAILLGLLQGITEFLPISSSGHLVLAQSFLGIKEPGLALDIALHFGTFFSVVVVFWKEIIKIFNGLINIKSKDKTEEQSVAGRIGILILVGSIPAGFIGIIFGKQIETLFQTPSFVGFTLVITAAILFIGNRFKGNSGLSNITSKDAFIIGSWQAFAILPGISRSGSTIVAAMMRGIDAETAARFSLLLSLPVILGANLILMNGSTTGSVPVFPLLTGIIVAFLSGIAAINILIKLTVKRKLNIFAWWCLSVGLLTIIFKS